MSGENGRDGVGVDRDGRGAGDAPGPRAGRPGALRIEVSPGELIDRIAMLELQAARLPDPAARARAGAQLADLTALRDRHLPAPPDLDDLSADLAAVNADLWAVEDDLRACEARADFGAGFIALARAVGRLNDRRADLRDRIDALLGADPREGTLRPPR